MDNTAARSENHVVYFVRLHRKDDQICLRLPLNCPQLIETHKQFTFIQFVNRQDANAKSGNGYRMVH